MQYFEEVRTFEHRWWQKLLQGYFQTFQSTVKCWSFFQLLLHEKNNNA